MKKVLEGLKKELKVLMSARVDEMEMEMQVEILRERLGKKEMHWLFPAAIGFIFVAGITLVTLLAVH